MDKSIISTEDYILYLMQKLEPETCDKIRLNKMAFLVEFAYIYKFGKELSNTKYAAIKLGPVIDRYKDVFLDMEQKGKIVQDGYILRPLKAPNITISEEIDSFVNEIISKYGQLSNPVLVNLTHATDSFIITTNNERDMGKIIDKDLAFLETFFEKDAGHDEIDESELPQIDDESLTEYDYSR